MLLGSFKKKMGASPEDRDVDSRTERKRSIGWKREGEGCLLEWRLEEDSGWCRRGMEETTEGGVCVQQIKGCEMVLRTVRSCWWEFAYTLVFVVAIEKREMISRTR